MSHREDFLLEIQTEELPPKSLLNLGQALKQELEKNLQKANLAFGAAQFYVTPRRLAVLIENLDAEQAAQTVERKGPALSAAFDKEGKPTPACLGFARSCGADPQALTIIKNTSGEWVGYVEQQAGKPTTSLLPAMVQQALSALPIPKRMRWGDNSDSFIRPVHSVILLFGKDVVQAQILGLDSNRLTAGHRFHCSREIKIAKPKDYVLALEKKGYVYVNFEERKALIQKLAEAIIKEKLAKGARILFQEALLNEVTGLVEWPVAICGHFDSHFLKLPREVLISAMQDHQRYFPVEDDKGKLLPNFVAAVNLESRDLPRVVAGNERVLRARLADAAFFYETDKKQSLEARVEGLKGIVFQAKLGSLYDKTQRLVHLATHLAKELKEKETLAARAAFLAKADLTSGMVGEFPELQGVMGYYYAKHDGESEAVAQALVDHYKPRFSGDELPQASLGCLLALADRLDTLVGVFGINHSPSGDKDPYGLRRAALGVLRILIEKEMDIDLLSWLNVAAQGYSGLENKEAASQVFHFIHERLKGLCQEQGLSSDEFAAVAALNLTNPYDIYRRIKAVNAFKKLPEAEALAMANKRVSNILIQAECKLTSHKPDTKLFEHEAEKKLARCLKELEEHIALDYKAGHYNQVMIDLARLREPVDQFFDQVMVMVDDKKIKENRLLLLSQLRTLFLQVADIALLVKK